MHGLYRRQYFLAWQMVHKPRLGLFRSANTILLKLKFHFTSLEGSILPPLCLHEVGLSLETADHSPITSTHHTSSCRALQSSSSKIPKSHRRESYSGRFLGFPLINFEVQTSKPLYTHCVATSTCPSWNRSQDQSSRLS